MKKVLAILLVLVVAMTGVMADSDPSSTSPAIVSLKSTITGYAYYGVSKNSTAVESASSMPETSPWAASLEISDAFSSGGVSFYLGYITNNATTVGAITVTAMPFARDGVDSPVASQKVGYIVSALDSTDVNTVTSTTVVKTISSAVSVPITFSKLATPGLHGEEVGLKVTATSADVGVAEAGDYTAVITVTVTGL